MIGRGLKAIAFWAFAVLSLPDYAQAETACALDRLTIKDDSAQVAFTIELADTAPARARGLMHRKSLAASQAMLFVYERPGAPAFWMRNTLIPLDMLFITPRGRVQHIHENAIPHDETPIQGGNGVLAVLEIRGGLAKTLKLAPGDIVQHPAFADYAPLWPCAAQ
ncbi:MAG: DUF192 domain-containing protein [Maritimibacter sp.]